MKPLTELNLFELLARLHSQNSHRYDLLCLESDSNSKRLRKALKLAKSAKTRNGIARGKLLREAIAPYRKILTKTLTAKTETGLILSEISGRISAIEEQSREMTGMPEP